MFLALTQQQNDIITIVLVVALALMVVAAVVRKSLAIKKAAQAVSAAPAAPEAAVPAVSAEPAPGSAGKLKLHDVEPKNAAMLMAIVADKIGKPLNELRFISIKEVK